MSLDTLHPPTSAWAPVTRVARPAPGEVHVFRVQIATPTDSALLDCLTPDERARANRFRLEPARARFVAARAGLRRILGECLALPPHAVPIRYGAVGKPTLDHPAPSLHFNVTHAGDLVLYALAADRPVGIDIEPVEPRRDLQAIATRYFSPPEREQFAAIPPAQRGAVFYQTWARKEALAKATGEGLWLTLGRYTVPVSPATSEPMTLTLPVTASPATWTLCDLIPAPGYIGALAAEGSNWTCRCLALEPAACS